MRRRRSRTTTSAGILIAALALAATACGNGTEPVADAGPAEELRIAGTDELRFDPDEMTVDAGTYTIIFSNEGQLSHQLALSEAGGHAHGDTDMAHPLGDTGEVAPGETGSFTVTLEPGSYEYACHVNGHDLGGMVGTLTVR